MTVQHRPPQLASKNHFNNKACMCLCTHSIYIRAQNIYFTKVLQMLSEKCVIIIYAYICVSDMKVSCMLFSRLWLKHFSWPENLMNNNNPITDADGLTISTEAQHQTPTSKKHKYFKINFNISHLFSFVLLKANRKFEI